MGNEKPFSGQPQTWSRSEVRSELARILVTAGEFEAFCLDKFDEAYRLFSPGMNRTEKENILLERFLPDLIIERLRTYKKRQFVQIEHLRPARPVGPESARDIEEAAVENAEQNQLNEQLSDLEEQRDRLDDQGLDTSYVIQEIRSIRKKLTQRPALEKNNIFAKRYRLIEIIGRGGYSIVWSARDLQVKRRVAIKFLHPQYTSEPSIVKRFNRGAKRMEQLADRARLARTAREQDLCFVRIIDQPRQERGYVYFVMDYLEGGDLHDAIIENKIKQNKAVDSLLQVGELLQFAHQCGITHRDIKPDNILLTTDGRSCLTDFDAVWALNTTSSIHGNQHVGTISYMPPEVLEQWDQAIQDEEAELEEPDNSQSLHAANILRDVYSLGLTLTFIYYGKNLPPIMSHPDFQERFLSQLQCPTTIRTAIARAIACDPRCRTQSVADFCADVRAGLHVHNRLGGEMALRVAEHREVTALVEPMPAPAAGRRLLGPPPPVLPPAPLLPIALADRRGPPAPPSLRATAGTAESLASTQLFIRLNKGPISPVLAKTVPSLDVGWIDMAAALNPDAEPPQPEPLGSPPAAVQRWKRWLWMTLAIFPLLVLGGVWLFWTDRAAPPNREPTGAADTSPRVEPPVRTTKTVRRAPPLPQPAPAPGVLATGSSGSVQRAGGADKGPLSAASPPDAAAPPSSSAERLTPQQAYRAAGQSIEDYRNQGNSFDRQCRNLGARGVYIFDITLDAEAHVAEVDMEERIGDDIKKCLVRAIKNIPFPRQLAQQRIQRLDIVIGP